jgi:hypothetical protein
VQLFSFFSRLPLLMCDSTFSKRTPFDIALMKDFSYRLDGLLLVAVVPVDLLMVASFTNESNV